MLLSAFLLLLWNSHVIEGEISNFQSRLDTFEDILAALEKKEKEANENEANKSLEE